MFVMMAMFLLKMKCDMLKTVPKIGWKRGNLIKYTFVQYVKIILQI